MSERRAGEPGGEPVTQLCQMQAAMVNSRWEIGRRTPSMVPATMPFQVETVGPHSDGLTFRGKYFHDRQGSDAAATARSGDGPLSVRVRPSSLKRDCDRRAMSTGERCLVNVHAKSRLTLEPLRTLRPETKGQAGACPDRTRAIPCTVRAVTGHIPLTAADSNGDSNSSDHRQPPANGDSA